MNYFKNVIAVFAKHPTAANLLMILFVILGAISVGDIRRETFPDFTSTEIQVTAFYPGATAKEVESAVCERIEEAVEGVPILIKVTSKASEGQASVILEMEDGSDPIEFTNDIKTEVEAITAFPDEVEDVVVKRLNRTDQVISIAVTGPMSEAHLKLYCDELKEKLQKLELVSQVELTGFSKHQLLVEIPYYQMMRLGLSLSDIQNVISSQSVDMPAGSIESVERDYLIRFVEERRNIEELKRLVVVANEAGAEVRLGDIAKITDNFKDPENMVRFNGKRAGILQINKNKSEDALDILDQVKIFLEDEQKKVPPGVQFTLTNNVSKIVRDRLNMISENGIEGLVLVFITLWLFFNIRMSFWVAMGLPVSFFLTFFFMKQIGFSFNMLSMVGLLIAVGILVDDAIVIAENVAAHMEKGKNSLEATIDGVSEVAGGVWSSFLTTLFIFGSLALSMEGMIGKVLYAIPVVLILTLSVSMVEAFCILPNHLAHSLKKEGEKKRSTFRLKFEQFLDRVREKVVGRIADWVVEHRYLFLGCVIFVFFLSISMLAGGVLKVKGFPDTEGEVLQARILLPQGTSLQNTEKVVNRVVEGMKKVDEELTPLQPEGRKLIQNYTAIFNTNADAGESGPHVATVSLDLLNAEERSVSVDTIITKWRDYVGVIPDVINIAYKEPTFGPGGLPIEIQLQGKNLDDLKIASTKLIDWLRGYEGVFDLDDNLRPGKPELQIRLNKGAYGMGFTASEVARQLRSAFQGVEAGEIIRLGESYEINVKISAGDMQQITDLSGFYIMSPSGKKVPLQSVAKIEQDRGWGVIQRVDGTRTVTITGDIDTSLANAQEIIGDSVKRFFPELEKEFPEISFSLEGEQQETKTSMAGMVKAFLIGIFGVYIILSLQFKNYIEPVVVMLLIPFALIGVIWGHILMGLDLTMPSIMGFISLAGIVVNDSILLVIFIRNHLREGDNIYKAAAQASRSRFRAVLLTSVTTIMGLLPLMSERSMQAQILLPLACSIVFGLLATTLLVLFVIPAFYSVLADFGLVESKR